MLAVCVTFSIRSGMLDAFAAGAGSSDMFKIESSQLALEKVSGEGCGRSRSRWSRTTRPPARR